MSNRRVIHVVPNHTKGGWDVKQEGKPNPISHHELKDRAIQKGRSEANTTDLGQLKIHKKNNLIQTEYTYGKDPRNILG